MPTKDQKENRRHCLEKVGRSEEWPRISTESTTRRHDMRRKKIKSYHVCAYTDIQKWVAEILQKMSRKRFGLKFGTHVQERRALKCAIW